MSTKCNGCDGAIYDILYMDCSKETCKKSYHLKCLAMKKEKFEALTQEQKELWVCPECLCTMPKKDNSNTPVRGIPMNKTFTPSSFVNTERGVRINPNEVSMVENDPRLHEEIRDFRYEMISRLDEQRREYTLLQKRFVNTENVLQELLNYVKVLHEKVSKVDELETQITLLKEKNAKLEASMKENTTVVNTNEINNTPIQPTVESSSSYARVVQKNQGVYVPNKESGAIKPAMAERAQTNINQGLEKKSEQDNEGKWSVVNRRKTKFPITEVKRGGSTKVIEIQGTERKKYLHVWRLQKDTTVESLEKYVSTLCGEGVHIKINKIKHKTERDYASFIIGVPESKYDILTQPENWAINIEFCEWVWFRRHTNNNDK